jgi:4-amino-4-deoxy-L-arabinose transferase-like glycosyltransferase
MILSRGWTAVLLLLILALAAVLRLWRLDTLPPGLYHDEAYNGLDALSLVQGKTFPQFYEGWELYALDAHGDNPPVPTRWPVFFEGNYGREPLHVYLMALSIWLFGATPFAIRLVPAVSGVFAVLLTYFAARTLLTTGQKERQGGAFADGIPLLAAFFLAILMPAIHFSRFGIRAMLFVPIELLTVIFFWRGYNLSQLPLTSRQQRSQPAIPLSFLAAGFFLGLGIYTYASARLFPLLFVAFVLFWAWQDWPGLRQNLLSVGSMTLVSLLTALPLLLFFWRYPYFFVFRIAYVANKGLGAVEDKPLLTWLLNVGRVVRGLYWQGETHLRHNLPGRPYLDPIQAILFTLGLLQTVRHKLNPRTVFLLLWLVVMLLPTILSGDAPHFGRMTGAVGVVAILAAIGLAWLGEWLIVNGKWLMVNGKGSQKGARFLLLTFNFLLLTATLTFTIRDYFGRYANQPQLAADFYQPDWALGQYAANKPEETAVYLTPTQEEMATIYFALGDPDRLRSYSGTGLLIPAGRPGAAALYLVRPEDRASWQQLTQFFTDYVVDQSQESFWALHVPESAAQAIGTVENRETAVSFADQIQLLGWSLHTMDNQVQITLFWQARAEILLDYTAYVHILDGSGQILAQSDRQPDGYPTTDWQNNELVLDTYTVMLPNNAAGPFVLETGFYDLATLARLGETAVLTETFTP